MTDLQEARVARLAECHSNKRRVTTNTPAQFYYTPAFFTMKQMGHEKLTTTQLYMHLVNLESDEWTCKAATTKEEAMSIIEGGFQYVTTIEGIQLFRKRK